MTSKPDLSNIQTIEDGRQQVELLFQMIEALHEEIEKLKEENRALKAENLRLKGEQGPPTIKGSQKNYSSEQERKKRKPKPKRRRKSKTLPIDEVREIPVDQATLPPDSVFKGYATNQVQEIEIKRHNIEFRRERYYSPSERKSYTGEMPAGYEGQFGPQLKAVVLSLYHDSGLSEPKIKGFLTQLGIDISMGTLSTWLTKVDERWEEEVTEIFHAGMSSTAYQHLDDTHTRVNGINYHCHVLCNPLYTYYATLESRNRLAVLQVLQHQAELSYLFNPEAVAWLDLVKTPKWAKEKIAQWPQHQPLSHEEVDALITSDLSLRLNAEQIRRIYDAGAVEAYRQQKRYPIPSIIITDDANAYRYIRTHQLCWVHEGRHYKKLTPLMRFHQQLLDQFRDSLWDFYRQLLHYSKDPDPNLALSLRNQFQTIFSQTTSYPALNKRIKATLANQDRLLTVLDHPGIPLHNNPAELAARRRVRKRDVSFGPRSDQGRRAWDIFMTLSETAKKLSVSFYHYVLDRLTQSNSLPSLADLIRSASPRQLSASR